MTYPLASAKPYAWEFLLTSTRQLNFHLLTHEIIHLHVEVTHGIKLSNNTEGDGFRGKFLEDLKTEGQES